MISAARIFSLLTIVVLGTTIQAWAQKNNPLDFDYEHSRIGMDVGVVSTWQTGVYTAGCGRFEKGSRLNALIGITYDYPLSQMLRFETLAGYQGRSLNSTYNSRENVVVQTVDKQLVRANVDFENLGNANFSYVFVMPSIRWNVTKSIFVGGGVSAGVLLGASTQYTKNIISKVVQVGDLGLAEVSYPQTETTNPYSKTFPEEKRTDASGFVLDGAIYAGVEFKVSPKVPKLRITPRVVYTIPLNAVFQTPDQLKINTLQLLIGARWNLD